MNSRDMRHCYSQQTAGQLPTAAGQDMQMGEEPDATQQGEAGLGKLDPQQSLRGGGSVSSLLPEAFGRFSRKNHDRHICLRLDT